MWCQRIRSVRCDSLAAVLLLLSACTFDVSNAVVSENGAEGNVDAAPTTPPGSTDADVAGPDAEPACAFTLDALCSAGDPDSGLDITADQVLDTDADPLCRDLDQPNGPQACLILVDSFSVAADVSLTAIGGRPLVIAAVNTMSISGLVDVSSRRERQRGAGANHDACQHGSGPQNDVGGAGGAAGGSYAALGGAGGTGDQDSSLGFDGTGAPGAAGTVAALPTFVRGGCPGDNGGDESSVGISGDGGDGGASGGALGLYAGVRVSVEDGGSVRATGAGGQGGAVQAGGGGGGSGGMIFIEAETILINGVLGANGGAGGEGGIRLNGLPESGDGGEDGTLRDSAAIGGTGLVLAGDGGNGSSLVSLVGEPGDAADGGGGGGGGSGGFIVLRGTSTVNGLCSPTPTLQ